MLTRDEQAEILERIRALVSLYGRAVRNEECAKREGTSKTELFKPYNEAWKRLREHLKEIG